MTFQKSNRIQNHEPPLNKNHEHPVEKKHEPPNLSKAKSCNRPIWTHGLHRLFFLDPIFSKKKVKLGMVYCDNFLIR